MVTKLFRVKSTSTIGQTPIVDDFSNEREGIRIMKWNWEYASDSTLVEITRDTEAEAYEEIRGQLTDGAFENAIVEGWEEVKAQWKLMFDNTDCGKGWEDYTTDGDFREGCDPEGIQYFETYEAASEKARELIEANQNLEDGLLVCKCDQRGLELCI